jgi:membrane associated rhomboid family serine protease
MSQLPDSPDNYCYRHPDRQSFVLCQRCGRTICPECQTQAAVGVHCPECVRESRQSVPRTRPAVVTSIRRATRTDQPVVTYSIIGISLLVFLIDTATQLAGAGAPLGNLLVLSAARPWTLITTLFVPVSILQVLFNLFSIFIIGRQIEPMVGRGRFAALFLLSGLASSVAVALFAPSAMLGGVALGASGAIFGMFGAYFIIARHLGSNATVLLIVIAINLGLVFFQSGSLWVAYVGGLLIGGLVAFIFLRTRNRQQRNTQTLLTGTVAVVLLILGIVGIIAA